MAAKKIAKAVEPEDTAETVAVTVGDVFNGWRVESLFTDEDGAARARIVLLANPLISSSPLTADLGAI